MTDEQWLWLYVNMAMDNDDRMNSMCPKCREEAVSDNSCSRCGKPLNHMESVVNPNFDREKFDRLSREDSGEVVNTNFDREAYDRQNKDGE
jgi:hypothetical protein